MNQLKYDKAYQECVVEMFRRVGLDKTYEEIIEFAKEPDWYMQYSWPREEEDSFIEWVTNRLRKDLKYTKKVATKQAHWLVFDIGWIHNAN